MAILWCLSHLDNEAKLIVNENLQESINLILLTGLRPHVPGRWLEQVGYHA